MTDTTMTDVSNSAHNLGVTGLEQLEMGAGRIHVDDKKNHQLPR